MELSMTDRIFCDSRSRYKIMYHESVDIDGLACRREFSRLIQQTGKRIYNRAHEWCCGHGAIGFQLLEDGLCKHLVLTDKFFTAIQDCLYTQAVNNLHDCVTIYHSESLAILPDTEKWDLFVCNPPWRSKILPGAELSEDLKRKMFDVDWSLHNHMWQNLRKFLTDDADVYLYEDRRFSSEHTWKQGMQQANLNLVNIFEYFGAVSTGYILHLKPQ